MAVAVAAPHADVETNKEERTPEMLELVGAVQSYDWGMVGAAGLVAQLAAANDASFSPCATKPYAELWMGTHPSGPAFVMSALEGHASTVMETARTPLSSVAKLPFLFKVLSVAKALSIQAHPDKELAKELHAARPDLYRDDNHKPEMALALTPFEALCSFRPLHEIAAFFGSGPSSVPELRAIVGESVAADFVAAAGDLHLSEAGRKKALQQLFTAFAQSPRITEQLNLFKSRVSGSASPSDLERLAMRLAEQHPGAEESGVFCVFLLNYITLQPGEAVFLAANEPHAYLSGECVECMALSDNVVRMGLTPKARDVPTLLRMLTYRPAAADTLRLHPRRVSPLTAVFLPPVSEFGVAHTAISAGDSGQEMMARSDAPAILLVTSLSGDGRLSVSDGSSSVELRAGSVILLGAGEQHVLSFSGVNAHVFCAFVPDKVAL